MKTAPEFFYLLSDSPQKQAARFADTEDIPPMPAGLNPEHVALFEHAHAIAKHYRDWYVEEMGLPLKVGIQLYLNPDLASKPEIYVRLLTLRDDHILGTHPYPLSQMEEWLRHASFTITPRPMKPMFFTEG